MKLNKIKYLMIVVILLLSLNLIKVHFKSSNKLNVEIYKILYNDKYLCSGFPIYKTKEYSIIATCSHLFRDDDYFVSFDNLFIDNTSAKITDIYTSPYHDISLLKVINHDFKINKMGNILKGEECYSYGYINDSILNISKGFILDESLYQNDEYRCDKLIIHNSKLVKGMSGGPLYNDSNQIIGLNIGKDNNNDDLSYAININVIKNVLNDYLNKTKNPWDGVIIRNNRKIETSNCVNISYELRNKLNNSIITKINNKKIKNNNDLYNKLFIDYEKEYNIEYLDLDNLKQNIYIYRMEGD